MLQSTHFNVKELGQTPPSCLSTFICPFNRKSLFFTYTEVDIPPPQAEEAALEV